MFLNSVSERPIMNLMRVRLRVRYMNRNEKLHVNHVKQLKGEIKLLTSTKLVCAGMTKHCYQCEEQNLAQCVIDAYKGTFSYDGREFFFFETFS